MCEETVTVVYVSAFDEDSGANAAPLQFSIIPEETTGPWEVDTVNGERTSRTDRGVFLENVVVSQLETRVVAKGKLRCQQQNS